MPMFPSRGSIASIDGERGSIALSGGEVVGFDCGRCMEFEPTVGQAVRVPLAIDIDGGGEALVVLEEGQEPKGDDEIYREHIAHAENTAYLWRYGGPGRSATNAETKSPYAFLKELSTIALPSSIERLVSEACQEATAEAVLRIEDPRGD